MPPVMDQTQQIIERLDFAVGVARAGGEATLRYFQQSNLDVDTKADGTPVTAADRACETLIRDRLSESFPGDGVLGEEFGDTPGKTGFRWIIDPIDGTFSFVRGVPLYTTLIGLEKLDDTGENRGEDRMVAGVIYAPALDEMVHARLGGGAWHTACGAEPVRARVTATTDLASATVCTTALEYWDEQNTEIWMRIAQRAGNTRGWPDAYAALLTATGRCDALVEPALQCWDIAPFGPILAEAGGKSTDWSGRETAHATANLTTNGAIHDELLAILNG